jgi:hypothetical protein
MVIENIMNLGSSQLEHATKLKLRESFSRILKEERNSRDQLERTLKNHVRSLLPPGVEL